MSWKGYGKELAWGLKTPVISAAVAASAFSGLKSLKSTPWVQEDLKAAEAADAAYQAELLRAYKFTYPDDKHVTWLELKQFEHTALNIDQTFRESNFEYQNHIYHKLMELYGSQQGTLTETYIAAQDVNLGEVLVTATGAVGLAGLVVAAASALWLPFAAKERADWRQD